MKRLSYWAIAEIIILCVLAAVVAVRRMTNAQEDNPDAPTMKADSTELIRTPQG